MSWFYYAIAAVILYGTINFLYKLAALKGYSGLDLVTIQAATVAVLSLPIAAIKGNFSSPLLILFFAAMNSLFFALGSLLKFRAFRYIPINKALPASKMNSVFVIMIGILFMGETLSMKQTAGVLLALSSLFLLLSTVYDISEPADGRLQIKGLSYAVAGALSTAVSMTAGKLAAVNVSKIHYIFFSYTFVTLYTLISGKLRKRTAVLNPPLFLIGISVGILNLSGYYLVLMAWSTGEMALVQGILSATMLVAVILAKIFFRERFTWKTAAAVLVSTAAVYLLKG